MCVYLCACVRACVRVSVCVCVCARARARACVCACVQVFVWVYFRHSTRQTDERSNKNPLQEHTKTMIKRVSTNNNGEKNAFSKANF